MHAIVTIVTINGTFLVWYFGLRGLFPQLPITSISLILMCGVLAVYVINGLSDRVRFRFSLIDLLFFVLFLFLFLVISFNYIFEGDIVDDDGRSIGRYHFIMITMFLSNYLLGRFFVPKVIIGSAMGVVGFVVVTLAVLCNVDFPNYAISLDGMESQDKGVYLALADIYAVGAIVAIASLRSHGYRILVSSISVVCLFFLTSRGALYSFIFAIGVYMFLFLSFRVKVLALGLSVLVSALFFSEIINLLESNPRMAFIFGDYSSDASLVARGSLLDVGLKHIVENPLFGVYGGTIRDTGTLGGYIHSILSFWQQFGIIAFTLVVLIVMFPAIIAIFAVLVKPLEQRDSVDSMIILLGIFCLVMISFARSYTWAYLWIYAGFLGYYIMARLGSCSARQ